MDAGILDVALLPAWSPSSVRETLTVALSRSTRLQAGIGYWTIDPALLGPDLVRALQDEHGFACVDLVIHGRNGRIRSKDSYGHEAPVRDTEH